MIINVSKDDILNGEQRESTTCMVSRAIMRKLKAKKKKADVCTDETSIIVGKKEYMCSEKLAEKILDFDAGSTVNPFKIKLENGKATVA